MDPLPKGRELRKLVSQNIRSLSHADTVQVFKAAQKMIAPEKFIPCASGTSLSLDSSIPDSVVERLYKVIQDCITHIDTI